MATKRLVKTVYGNAPANRIVRVYRLPETDEWLCRYAGAASGEGYFTSDKADAMATAFAMAACHPGCSL